MAHAWAAQYQCPSPPPHSVHWYDDEEEEASPQPASLVFSCIHRETPTQFARRFLQEQEHHPYGRSAQDLWLEVASMLSFAHTRLLLLDQAERLSLALCQYLLEYLSERTSCSLLLIGTPDLLSILARDASLSQRMVSCTLDQLPPLPEETH